MQKNVNVNIRVTPETKEKLVKLAKDSKREFSDYVRLLLLDAVEKKKKI
jgi:predicted DNA-binding protein